MTEPKSLLDMFEELDQYDERPTESNEIVRAPFAYPGAKRNSVEHILPLLPYRKSYIEPFGGSGAILLARNKSPLEVFNDRYGGVVALYRCVKDKEKLDKLLELLSLTIHSREEWDFCKSTWSNCYDDVERAARWYYTNRYSFASKSLQFGRSTGTQNGMSGKIINSIPNFYKVHERIKNVLIENLDWSKCFKDFDGPEAVFYVDPPYVDSGSQIYDNELTHAQHRDLINTIFQTKGFVAVSGYTNPLYEEQDWDARYTWEVPCGIKSLAFTDTNNCKDLKGLIERDNQTEVLWIKESIHG
jgi:DNA adenine methylase